MAGKNALKRLILLKTNEDEAPQRRGILQTFAWWGACPPPPPPLIQTAVKFATLRYIFAVFARITLNPGKLHYLMALFIAVLMNIRYCWLTKFQGKKRK